MNYQLDQYHQPLNGDITLSSSKSESNRALIMNALSGNQLQLKNLSDARDTQTMQRLLSERQPVWDVIDAGTTMRFCTAYLAIMGSGEIITGSDRMKERPIKLLVDALRRLGAKIDYLAQEGFPPLRISAQKNDTNAQEISIPGNISSQYISALLMIGPTLPDGISIELTGEIFSRPYIEMTLALMHHFGVNSTWKDQTLHINPQRYKAQSYTIESDWSGASYWYSMVALNQESSITLRGLRSHSFQGDQNIVNIMSKMGVKTEFKSDKVQLTSIPVTEINQIIDFKNCPDLAQTVMVVAVIKGIKLIMTGLESLKIKETDRVMAMKKELLKIGGLLNEENGIWRLKSGTVPEHLETIETYEDHRMAMAFAPVCMIRAITIRDIEVVQKSYPSYWAHLKSVGIIFNEC
ncbi:MAG: 3-phosphoshikimate 1-carboxyvinyltransferase [Cytophagales bacterium]